MDNNIDHSTNSITHNILDIANDNHINPCLNKGINTIDSLSSDEIGYIYSQEYIDHLKQIYQSEINWLSNVQRSIAQNFIIDSSKTDPSESLNRSDTSASNSLIYPSYQSAYQVAIKQGPHTNTLDKLDTLVFNIHYVLNPPLNHNNIAYSLLHNPQTILKKLSIGVQLLTAKPSESHILKSKPISVNTSVNCSKEQYDLIHLLRMMSPYRSVQYPCMIDGEMGITALNQVLEQPFVYLTHPDYTQLDIPIKRGQPLTLHWFWHCLHNNSKDTKDTDDLKWRLECVTVNAQKERVLTHLYLSETVLYIDSDNGAIGTVDIGNISHERLSYLLSAPIFSTALIKAQETIIRESLSDIALPPILEKIQYLESIQPLAKLYIQAIDPIDRATKGLLSVTPYFIYNQHEIVWNHLEHTVSLTTSSGRVTVLRNKASEAALLDSLIHLGLTSVAHQLKLVDKSHQISIDYDVNDRLAMQAWFINVESWAEFISKPSKLVSKTLIDIPSHHIVWLNWAENDFSIFKSLGFDIALDISATHLITHIDEVHIAITDRRSDTDMNNMVNIEKDSLDNQWFDLSLGVDIEGVRHNILPWLPTLLNKLNYTYTSDTSKIKAPDWVYLPPIAGSSRFIRLNIKPLHPWLNALIELVNHRSMACFNKDTLQLSHIEALRTGFTLGEGAVWQGTDKIKAMLADLKQSICFPEVALPRELHAVLRPYQQQGLNWLQFLLKQGLSGILADDMGLGKTLQTLSHILIEKQSGRMKTPVLVVAPVSLMGNWAKEAMRFTPTLRIQVFHGVDRHIAASELMDKDIIFTSYALLSREKSRWLAINWHILVLDEAQNIKNANTQVAKLVTQIKAYQRLCLSGTPIENNLGELWSLFHFLMPGFLYSFKQFNHFFRIPIEKNADSARLTQLRQRITPFMLRRTKVAVASELPAKVETISRIILSGKQADLYETIRLSTESVVRDALKKQGLARSQIMVLDALLKLRQVCCDPRLLSLNHTKPIQQSAKLEHLMALLPDMLAQGRRILIFSQFTAMLDLIEHALKSLHISWVKLTGQSTKRDAIIEQFTSGQVPLFLISLKAGGVGLNLPQADTVIHYDPWWNPAVEDQATDRAHRIGQKNTVFVYKIVAQGTIEERILALQSRKASLANSLYHDCENRVQPMFTEDEIIELLKPLNG